MDLTGLSFAAMRQIELARVDAERAFLRVAQESEPVVRPDGEGSYTLHRPDGSAYGYASRDHRLEEAAIAYVLAVLKAVVHALRDDLSRPAALLPAIVDRLWGEILTETYRDKHPRYVPADRFALCAAQTRLQQPWWAAFQDTLQARLLQPPTFGQQLKALVTDAQWNTAELTRQVGFDRKSVEDHLEDNVRPRGDTVATYEKVFTARLGRPVKFEM